MVTAFVITVRKMVKKNSEEMIFYKGKITQWVIQAARSIVDIKFLDLEKKGFIVKRNGNIKIKKNHIAKLNSIIDYLLY